MCRVAEMILAMTGVDAKVELVQDDGVVRRPGFSVVERSVLLAASGILEDELELLEGANGDSSTRARVVVAYGGVQELINSWKAESGE